MGLFGLGSLAYFILLLINAIAILHKERFLAPLGLTSSHHHSSSLQSQSSQDISRTSSPNYQTGFETYGPSGTIGVGPNHLGSNGGDGIGIKMRAIMLVDAVRTLMRSKSGTPPPFLE